MLFAVKTKTPFEDEMERKGENVVELSLDTHGVAEDIGAGLIAAKLRASKEKENIHKFFKTFSQMDSLELGSMAPLRISTQFLN